MVRAVAAGHGFAICSSSPTASARGIAHISSTLLGLYMFGSDISGCSARATFSPTSRLPGGAALTQLGSRGSQAGRLFPTLGRLGRLYGLLLAFGMYFPRRNGHADSSAIPMQARYFVILFGSLELVFGVTGTAAGVPTSRTWAACSGLAHDPVPRRGFPLPRRH